VKSRTKLLVATALLLSLSLVAYRLSLTPHDRRAGDISASPPAHATGTDSTDRRRNERTTVSALGRLAPRGEVISVGAPEGDRLTRLMVTEGQRVRAGDPLAYLDTHAEREREKHLIATRIVEARARLATETAYGRALVAEATARLQQLANLPALEVQMQESRVRVVDAALEDSTRDLERFRSLAGQGFIAQQALDHHMLAVRRHQLELSAARLLLDKLRQALTLDLSLAEAQLETARASLARAQSSGELDSLGESLRQAEARLERSVIRAPITGEILKIVSRPGESTGALAILEMGDTATMYAVAEVYETDSGLVRPRQRARITSPALPHPLSGTVESVGRIVSKNAIVDIDPAAAADRRVVEVKIVLDDSKSAAQLVKLQVAVSIDVRNR